MLVLSLCFIVLIHASTGSLTYILHHSEFLELQSGPEKNAQSLMHRHFANICSRIKRFLPYHNAQKTSVYFAMQNSLQLVKYSLINSRNWIHVTSDLSAASDIIDHRILFT